MDDLSLAPETWSVAGRTFTSRLIVGTGKYKDYAQNAAAARASGAEIVTVAVRRVNLTDPNQPMLMDYVRQDEFTYLPNTAGCFTGEDAVRTLRLAREAGGWNLVKLEVLSDPKTLYPDMEETLRSLKLLVKDGFDVMVYCSDDPVYARKLEEAGAAAIMPLAAPGILAVAVFVVVFAWNEFLFAFIFTGTRAKTAPLVIAEMIGFIEGVDWGVLFAASTVQLLPVLLFVMAMNRYLVAGLTSGATKG